MPIILQAKTVGAFAAIIADSVSDGIVIGKTSQGVFLKCKSDQIVFVTQRPFRGPLTINVHGINDLLEKIEVGMGVEYRRGQVLFPELEIAIQTSSGEVWDSPMPQVELRSEKSRVEIIKRIVDQMLNLSKKNNNREIADLIETIISPGDNSYTKNTLCSEQIGNFIDRIIDVGVVQVLSEDIPLLGIGEGLTPAGDDVILGLVLGLNRWKEVLLPETDISRLNQKIIQKAYDQTTTLSANLIECAVCRQSDERLMNALDLIMCNYPYDREILKAVEKWGSSSGSYALVGILCAILFL